MAGLAQSEGKNVIVDWVKLDRTKWDRAAEALIFRVFDRDGNEVFIYDGAGGDGGRDIEVVKPDGYRIILQLKHFPEGFSSVWGQRRRQIKKSFRSALAHNPDEWVLVVPNKLSSGEKTFVEKLKSLAGPDSELRVRHFAQTWLDNKLAKFPDLGDAINRVEWERMAAMLKVEDRLPPGRASEVAAAIEDLQVSIDSADPHWTWQISSYGGMRTQILTPKTPNAHLLSPVSIQLETDESGVSAELRERIRAVMGFGLDGEIRLPTEAVKRFEVTGPRIVAEVSHDVEVVFGRAKSSPEMSICEVELFDSSGTTVTAFIADVQHFGIGEEGSSLRIMMFGILAMELRLPHADDVTEVESKVDWSIKKGASLRDVVDASDAWLSLAAGCGMGINAEGKRVVTLSSAGITGAGEDRFESGGSFRETRNLAEDLDIVGRAFRVQFLLPETYSKNDLAMARALRLMIEGGRTRLPTFWTLPIEFSVPADGEPLQELLKGSGLRIYGEFENMQVELAGRAIDLGVVHIGDENVVLRNAAQLADQLEKEPNRSVKGALKTASGGFFSAFIPRFVVDHERPLPILPWGLDGIEEP